MPSVIPITLNPDTILSSADSSLSKESKLLVDITTVNGANPTLPAVARAAFGVRLTPENAYRELLLPTSGADGATRMIKSYESMAQASDLIRKHDMTITTPSPQMVLKHFSDNGAPTSTVPSWWKEAKDAYIAAMNEFYRGNQQARAADKPFARYGAKKCESAMHYFNCLEAVKLAGIAHRQGEKDAAIEQLEKAIESLYFCIDNLREIARDPNDVGIIAALNEFGYRPLQKQLQKLQDE